jgi:hypothetical protein
MGWDPHQRELSRTKQAVAALWPRISGARLGLRTRETTQTNIAGHGICKASPRDREVPISRQSSDGERGHAKSQAPAGSLVRWRTGVLLQLRQPAFFLVGGVK